ncbi:MAG: DMT family transporter [candidate division WOR-3 bacterium]|nr:DMT family transporter [candidate division WOR-3 bacterium]
MVVLGASVMWAIEPVMVKLSYQTTDVLSTFATRSIFCLITIAAYMLVTGTRFRVEMKYLPKLVYLSIAATLFADLMYVYALSKVQVINAVLIGHMQPIFIVLIGFVFLKDDRITKFDYLGILFMIVAGLLVTSRTLNNLVAVRIGTVGDLYVLLATISWATTAIVARRYLKGLNAAIIAFYRFFFAGVVFVIYLMFLRGITINNIYQILLGVIIGVGTVLYYEGIKLIKAAQVSALELSTPLFATVLGFLVLKETITTMQFIGILALLGGIYFLSRKERLADSPLK